MSGLLKDRGLNSVVFIVDDDGFLPRAAGDLNQRLQAAGHRLQSKQLDSDSFLQFNTIRKPYSIKTQN